MNEESIRSDGPAAPQPLALEPVARPRDLFLRSGHVPSRLLYRWAARIGLAQFGPPKTLAAEIELGRAGVLLSAVAIFDFFAWWMLIYHMAEKTSLQLWVNPLLASLFTTVTIMFELHLLTQPQAFDLRWLAVWRWPFEPDRLGRLFPYIVRVLMIFLSALATSQPMETLMFGGAIKRRQHEESVIHFATDVHQRLLFDEADQLARAEAARRAVGDAVSDVFRQGDGSGEIVGGLGTLRMNEMRDAGSTRRSAEQLLVQATTLANFQLDPHPGCPTSLNLSLCGGARPPSLEVASSHGERCVASLAAERRTAGYNRTEDRLLERLHDAWEPYRLSACGTPESAVYGAAQCATAQEIVDKSAANAPLRQPRQCNARAFNALADKAQSAARSATAGLGALQNSMAGSEKEAEDKLSAMEEQARAAGQAKRTLLEADAARISATIAAMRQAIPTLLRSAPGTYYLCAPHGLVSEVPCGKEGLLPGILKPYQVKEYDFNEQLRVLRDLTEGRPPRWPPMGPDTIGRLRSFGLAREYYGEASIAAGPPEEGSGTATEPSANQTDEMRQRALALGQEWKAAAARDGHAYRTTWWFVFFGAFFIPMVVFTWKISLSPSLQHYFRESRDHG